MSDQNALELAGEIGHQLHGDIGKNAFEELELCYASRIAPRFASSSKLRSYVNLNFYWARSYFKNTIMEEFQECLPSSFAHRNVTSATLETMFGSTSTSGTKIIPPLFWGYELCFMPELLAFLQTKDMKDKVNVFNEVLEGKETTRNLLKFGNASQSLTDNYKNGVKGLRFDGTTLSYRPDTCFVIATRPVDNQVYTYLEQSGFWSRFHTIQFRITDSTARDIFTGALYPSEGTDVASDKKELKAINEGLFVKRNNLSSELPNYNELLLPILKKANEIGVEICKSIPNLDSSTITNVRIRGDIIREVRAYKILHSGALDADVQKWALSRLPHFFDFIANPIIAPSLTGVKQKTSDACLKEVLQLTKGHSKKRDEIQEILQKQGYSRTMIDRALEIIKERGLNKTEKYGEYITE